VQCKSLNHHCLAPKQQHVNGGAPDLDAI